MKVVIKTLSLCLFYAKVSGQMFIVKMLIAEMLIVCVVLAPHTLMAEPTPAPSAPQVTQETQQPQAEPPNAEQHTTIPKYFTTKPPFTEGIFPCTMCHATMKPDKTRRQLQFHAEIVLKHAAQQRWCLDCHDADNRDRLRLANGDHVTFDESYLLCGQCHGNVFRDWKTGIHGKRIGSWNSDKPGDKKYFLCVNCHNPHSPNFIPVKPLPAPVRPKAITDIKGSSTLDIEGQKIYIPVYNK
ncbi:MAG: hypothetical protein HQL05_11460 [Nitrospirae bacterium]|uniref:cytochrome c3 family protein n=1 Tax=Candidatus Magnetobacterium casense TaxID=1455061 RepID=UPI000697F763|nr:cytochrome c3 family protein [Candidatus Magnetobacterium casensis]MBF0338436.1 hypothetical protein [Nitrospirota bacterium]